MKKHLVNLFIVFICFIAHVTYATNVTFRINMEYETVPSGVFLGGDWNGWSVAAFDSLSDGDGDDVWEVTINLAPGSYNYLATIEKDSTNFEDMTISGCGVGPGSPVSGR